MPNLNVILPAAVTAVKFPHRFPSTECFPGVLPWAFLSSSICERTAGR